MADESLDRNISAIVDSLKELGIASSVIEDLQNKFRDSDNQADAFKSTLSEIENIISSTGSLEEENIEKKRQALALARETLNVARNNGAFQQEEIRQAELLVQNAEKNLSIEIKRGFAMNKALDKMIGMKQEALGLSAHLDAISHIWNDMSKQEALERVLNKAADSLSQFGNAIITASLELDNVAAKVAKATSTTQYAAGLEELRMEALASGASVEQLGDNFITLNNTFSDFNRINSIVATRLATTATALNAANFSTESFAKTLDLGVKALNMSTDEVENFAKELVNFGKVSGISMQKLSKDLTSVGPQLVLFGSRGERVFKELSLASKNLGIELDRLFGIAEQYTTFQGAADAAAKLNSILGGNFINSLDLMNASLDNPVETFRLLKDSMDASGKSFSDMSPAMKRVIADAAGFSDVSEAARIFNMNVDEGSIALEEQAITQEKLNEMNRSFIGLQEKINKLFAQMTPILTPVVDKIGAFVDFISQMVSENPELFKFLGWATASILAFGALGMVMLTLTANISLGIKAFGGMFSLLGSGLDKIKNIISSKKKLSDTEEEISRQQETRDQSFIKRVKAIATAVRGTWKEIVAFGAAIALAGAGIFLASKGLAELVLSFKELTGEQILGGLGAILIVMGGFVGLVYALAAAIPVLGAAGAVVVGPLLALGAAFLLIGAGIGIAALGISSIIEAFGTLGSVFESIGNAISGSISSLTSFFKVLSSVSAENLLLIGPSLFSISAGIAALVGASSLAGVSSFFGEGPFEKLEKLSQLATNSFATNMEKIASSIERVVQALNTEINSSLSLQLEKLERLSNMGTLNIAPAAIANEVPVINVQEIIVQSQIKTPLSQETKKESTIINLSVPITIDGGDLDDTIVAVVKERIKLESENASSIRLVTE